MSVEKIIGEFIEDIPVLKKSKNSAQVNIWTSQLRDTLERYTLSQTDISQMNAIFYALQKDYYLDNIYDNLDLFLKLLIRKELTIKPKVVPKTPSIIQSSQQLPIIEPIMARVTAKEEYKQNVPIIVEPKLQMPTIKKNKIFIVHGHDDISKLELARILTELDLNPIILHEQPNQSRTIIEKFEEYSKDVKFAFVLLTPDDYGGVDKENLKKRARQNVILELGFFLAKLGRSNVCCLYKSDVELPTDYSGVTYLSFTNSPKECYREIIQELKTAGFKLKI